MTLLTIVQAAARECGLAPPSSVVSNTDQTAVRMFALVNEAGVELARRHNWTILTKEKTFSTTAAEVQAGAIPGDFDRFVDETLYNRSRSRSLVGPLSPQEWQQQKALTTSVLMDKFRIRGTDLLMMPAPPAGDTIAFEYVSAYWVDTDADRIGDQAAFTADAQTALLDERMLTSDIVWRYRRSVGLNYAEDFRTAQATILDRIARDGGRSTISMGASPARAVPSITVPEGSWPL